MSQRFDSDISAYVWMNNYYISSPVPGANLKKAMQWFGQPPKRSVLTGHLKNQQIGELFGMGYSGGQSRS
jgi:hypothetical protein